MQHIIKNCISTDEMGIFFNSERLIFATVNFIVKKMISKGIL